MKNKTILSGIAIMVALVIGFIVIGYFSASNKEVKMRESVMTQQGVLKDFHTVVWKVLQEKAKITDNYVASFDSVYSDIMSERYEGKNGGSLFNFVTESNPQFDASMFHELAQTVEAKRTEFFYEQKRLRELNQQHKVLLHTFPYSMYIGSRDTIAIETLSSTKTDEVFKTGVDDSTLY